MFVSLGPSEFFTRGNLQYFSVEKANHPSPSTLKSRKALEPVRRLALSITSF